MHACLEPGEIQKLLQILVESSSGKFFATFFFFFFLTLPASKGLAGLGSLQLEWSIYTYLQSPLMMMETSLKINQLSSCFPGLFLQLKNCRMVCVGSTSEEVKAMMGGILF